MSVRILATFLVAVLAALVAADVPDFPRWLDAVCAALIAGFAAVGIRSSREP